MFLLVVVIVDHIFIKFWLFHGFLNSVTTLISLCYFVDLLPFTPKLETVSSESMTLHGHSGSVYSTQFSPDNSILLSASEDTSGKF